MASGKLSPRQKMINMMYLVLTAMLALNVSKDILKAFHQVEVSMIRSGKNIDEKNATTIEALKKQLLINEKKVRPYYARAVEAHKISLGLVTYIENIKSGLVKVADGRKNDEENALLPESERELAEPDNIEKHAFFFIKKNNGAEGRKLKEKIQSTRLSLLKLLDAEDQKKVKTDLFTPDPPSINGIRQSWESEMFEHAPLAAVMTMLTKIQNDSKSTEMQVLDLISDAITKEEKSFDKLVAIAKPISSTQVPLGEEFEAEVYLAAYDSKQNSEMLVNGRPIEVKNGRGLFKTVAHQEGENKYDVLINIKKNNGEIETQRAEIAYTAFKGMATVSADKMNVVYVGLDNPLSVSAPGTSPDQLVVSCAGGTITGRNGKYSLRVSGGRFAEIVVSVKENNGSVRRIESKRYRVKTVPQPIPMIGRISGSNASPAEIRNFPYVLCDLQNFVFDSIRYRVVSYDARLIPKSGNTVYAQDVKGQALPSKILNAVAQSRGGEFLIITNIKAEALGTQIGIVTLRTPITLTIR